MSKTEQTSGGSRPKKWPGVWLCGLASAALAIAGCGGGGKTTAPAEVAAPTASAAPSAPAPAVPTPTPDSIPVPSPTPAPDPIPSPLPVPTATPIPSPPPAPAAPPAPVAPPTPPAPVAPPTPPAPVAPPTPTPVVSAPVPPVAPSANPFTPNYAAELEVLLHWPRPELLVYWGVQPNAARRDIAVQGFRQWEVVTEGRLRFRFTDDPGLAPSADMTVQFVPGRSLGNRVVGRTLVQYTTNDLAIRHAEILLDETLADDDLYDTAIHEMGHALAIGGHSSEQRDTMFYAIVPPAEITARDLNTMKSAYPWLYGRGVPPIKRSPGRTQILRIDCPRP